MGFDSENVNVGDKVICCMHGGDERIGIVVKKTPSGLLDVDFGNYKERYRKDGRIRGHNGYWDHKYIEYATEGKLEEIRERRKKTALVYEIQKYRLRDLNVESLEAILKICEDELKK